jgi:hypothetical protein
MNELPVRRRSFHTFLSHSHSDKVIVDHIYKWLNEVSGVPVWYDGVNLPPSSRIAAELPRAISNCRSMMLILSKSSVNKGWVQEEYDAAIDQRTKYKDFRILPVLIEECEVPGFLRTTKWVSIQNGKLDLFSSNEILDGLYLVNNSTESQDSKDLYVSRSWRDSEAAMADRICQQLINAGFRLIGDSIDQAGFKGNENQARIRSIMSSCGGIAAVLPHRGNGSTSEPMLREIAIGLELGLPALIAAEPDVRLSGELEKLAVRLPTEVSELTLTNVLKNGIEDLVDEWKKPLSPHYTFFATDLTLNDKRNQIIANHIERITAMPCIIGDRLVEGQVQQLITEKISHAFMIIADISEHNVNTLIEAGIARGANRDFHLISGGVRKSPPFMFRDQQVDFYSDDTELLGVAHRISYPYRRRVLNYELIS